MPLSTKGDAALPPGEGLLTRWMSTELACIAGRREFAKGRYTIADLAEEEVQAVLARFEEDVRQHRKVALICLIPRTAANMNPVTPSLEVLRELSSFGAAMSGGRADELLDSAVLERPVTLDCPVTGVATTYSFFAAAFCPQAANADDALHDLPLSAPLPLINITSDALAFAMYVRDMAMERHGLAPHQLSAKQERAALFADCVARWQRFSLHTLTSFAERTRGTRCPVRVSADGVSWQAAHNDPVFAEMRKEMHMHDMPSIYAAELVERWNAILDRQGPHFHARAGQSGGRRLPALTRRRQCLFAGLAGYFRWAAAAH